MLKFSQKEANSVSVEFSPSETPFKTTLFQHLTSSTLSTERPQLFNFE